MTKAFINGATIFLLVPAQSAETEQFRKFVEKIAISVPLGAIAFKNYTKTLTGPNVLISLVRPELLSVLIKYRKEKNSRSGPNSCKKPTELFLAPEW